MNELPPVSRTALGVARIRAAECRRPDPLFDDPYAAAFVSAAGVDAAPDDSMPLTDDQRRWRAGIAFHVSIRTRFFDDYVRAAIAAGIGQVVILGAGLDTRAFRLEAADHDVQWFELDLPDVLAFKQTVLDGRQATPQGRRVAVATDLAGAWGSALQLAGFSAAAPTAWLAEGLLVYLEATAVEHVLGVVTSLSAAGSRIAAERGDVAAEVAGAGSRDLDEASSLWARGLDGGIVPWLSGHGWHPTVYAATELATSYGRQAPVSARSGFVTATR